MTRRYRSKLDGTTWKTVRDEYHYNAATGTEQTHTTLVCTGPRDDQQGTEITLATSDEDEWNDLELVSRDTKYVVAIYDTNRAFGGREEGGWWFDCGTRRRILRVTSSRRRVYQLACRINRLLTYWQRDHADIGSVVCDGILEARVFDNDAPVHFPTERPRYE